MSRRFTWGCAYVITHKNKKKKGGRKMMSFAEVIELDNQFDRFLFEGGNDPFGKDTDDLLAPEEE